MSTPVAIVGMGAALPGAASVDAFWDLVLAGRDATAQVPAERWVLSPKEALHRESAAADRVRSVRAGIVDPSCLRPSLEGFDLLPHELRALDPSIAVLLYAADQAWRGTQTYAIDRSRAAVVLGNIVLPTDGASALSQWVVGRSLERDVAGPNPSAPPSSWNRWVAGLPAGVLARALGLGGDAFTLDAACASSLFAVQLAVGKLRRGEADVVLTGGLSRPSSLYTQMGFSQLGAISPRGRCSPFDARGDGLVVGEGAGVLVLKRLDDALSHGDTIHAVVRGVGLSNDVDGRLLAPSAQGQLRAMRAAYDQAQWRPGDVELIECHATGTPVGDAVEFASLRALRQADLPREAYLGASKANVGHLLTAAGAVAMIRAVLAMQHSMITPMANFERASERLELKGSGLHIPTEATPWPQTDRPQRAAVSGFGFGGTNAHVLLEQHVPERPLAVAVPRTSAEPLAQVAIVGLGAHVGPWPSVVALRERLFNDGTQPAPAPKATFGGLASPPGWFIDALEVPVGRFRIPPAELAEILPQQLLLLEVAAEARDDVRGTVPDGHRCGVFAGVELDFGTTDYHLRWEVRARAKAWAEAVGHDVQGSAFDRWVDGLCDALGPALDADRTMGGLASVAASRVARELNYGGPSYTLSSEESSGLTALQVAARALQARDVDLAMVGGVSLGGDVRATVAELAAGIERGVRGEGAAAVVLKRLDDAQRDGDRIYAVLHGHGAASSNGVLRPEPTRKAFEASWKRAHDEAEYVRPCLVDRAADASTSLDRVAVNEAAHVVQTSARLGDAGAASGLVSVVATALRLHHQVVEGSAHGRAAQRWLHDRCEGPRAGVVAAASSAGLVAHTILGEYLEHALPWTPEIHEGLFVVTGEDVPAIAAGLERLAEVARDVQGRPIADVARGWWHEHGCPSGANKRALALTARTAKELGPLCSALAQELRKQGEPMPHGDGKVMFTTEPLGAQGELAFVFPGSGSQFEGMGRALLLELPDAARRLSLEPNARTQLQADLCWNTAPKTMHDDARGLILAQVTLGTLGTDAVRRHGLQPHAVIGYSLGETAGLFALGAWGNREDMLARVSKSPLFASELTGPCDAVRRAWSLSEEDTVHWSLGVLQADAATVDAALDAESHAYRLIVNTPRACVIGGDHDAVQRVVERTDAEFHPLRGVTTVHCEVVREVEAAYRELHVLPTHAPDGIRFYSGAWGRAYAVDQDTAAAAVTDQAVHGVDYPAVIRAAYEDGVRLFLELGPGGSCTRMIDAILGDRPHWARSISAPSGDGRSALIRALGWLVAHGVDVDLAPLFEPDPLAPRASASRPGPSIDVVVGRAALGSLPQAAPTAPPVTDLPVANLPVANLPATDPPATDGHSTPVFRANHTMPLQDTSPTRPPSPWLATLQATAEAHAAFLRTQASMMQAATAMLGAQGSQPVAVREPVAEAPARWTAQEPPRALDYEACMTFAVGKIGDVLGASFAEIDAHPTRVRLPDAPLMLVDRILQIDGEPRSMAHGRVVTEHDVRPDAWYLDAGRIPTCVAVEAGQADLFLSAFLGIDFETRGHAVYRLLDATVTFHGRLPPVGATIHYDIRIERFFRQGDTWLFNFAYDATVDGQPLMSMRDGCAGFFTEAELAAGKGVVDGGIPLQRPRSTLADRPTFAPVRARTLDATQLRALRMGNLVTALGPEFADLGITHPRTLPGAPMDLVHRITKLEPEGGEFGLGLVEGEADIEDDAWFITCHFVDDPVMPGTLMYECCLHTLRVFLLSLGWVGDENASFEPRLGVKSRLACRGQVLAHTQCVTYRITMREFGADPEPYVICDATMFADGKRIVDIVDMSAQLRGVDVQQLRQRWGGRQAPTGPRYDKATLEAYAYGKPSEAFGPQYAVFDGPNRKIARLPGAPFQFLDRVTEARGTPFVCEAGADCVAEVDRQTWAWTLPANRQEDIAFAVLLEIGLQACGWLAAYVGSALTSEEDLKFRNLGGKATLHRAVSPQDTTVVMKAELTRVASSGAMIIQHFNFAVLTASGEPIYDGTTYFGFFTHAALADQKGLRDVVPHAASEDERARSRPAIRVPDEAPLPTAKWRMLDRVDLWIDDGGTHGRGYLEGSIDVDPSFWFFRAHFHEDPVWPGSLGLEAFLQLLKVYACDRFELGPNARFTTMPIGHEHGWEYRGQVIPTQGTVVVQAHIIEVVQAKHTVIAEGILCVDGRPIYALNRFALEARP